MKRFGIRKIRVCISALWLIDCMTLSNSLSSPSFPLLFYEMGIELYMFLMGHGGDAV
jgi:hypothetical protein